MKITIRGRNLPGKVFCPSDATPHHNVHVAVQERRDPVGLVRGDARSATWDVHINVERDPSGEPDFKGPAVHGKRGERFLYLTWGDLGDDGSFTMFRRAKLMLDRVEADLLRTAEQRDEPLVALVDLTDRCGGPRCARIDPPALTWTLDQRGER